MKQPTDDPVIKEFITRLGQLDSGGRARLKRNAGKRLSEAKHETLGLFYRLFTVPPKPTQEETFFLLATLYPLAEGGGQGNLGALLRQARNEKNSKGLDRRMAILLDSDETQLAFRLRQAILLLHSSRIKLDWPCLLLDLLYWTHPEKFVQRQWARSYYIGNPDAKA